MNFTSVPHQENSPYFQLLIIGGYALLGLILGSCLSIGLLMSMYGFNFFENVPAMSGADPAFSAGLKIAQLLTTVFTFIAPPLLLSATEKRSVTSLYQFKRPRPALLLLVLLLMAGSLPLVEWLALTNQKMALPELLRPVEQWMKEKEEEAMKMTLLLLRINSIWDFLLDLFIIALLPGIAEELLFRGAVQRAFYRMYSNPHTAIWLSAFIFSAIHLQFYGFVPRLFLGAMFGYIYLWTGSLWYAMFAHFLNNGYAVCQAWYLQAHHLPLENADNSLNFPWYGYLISLILTIFLLIYLKKTTAAKHGEQLD